MRSVATAFDACLICGDRGYYQEGADLTCLHCGCGDLPADASASPGGCNPIPLRSRVEGSELVLAAADLAAGAGRFGGGAAHAEH